MKRRLLTFVVMLLLINGVSVMADEAVTTEAVTNETLVSVPSDWALEEVRAAIQWRLVPEVMMTDYQATIKRYEYVLLALEVAELANDETQIIYERPFSDISNHPYEEEIVRAYNLGLINGYEDGSFKPDSNISRQEIATLVVNLVKAINEDEVVGLSEEFEFADGEIIGNWAMQNVNYCYAKGIMKGIGQDKLLRDYMDPLGNATVEQAILLLYRLTVEKDIYEELTYQDIVMTTINDDRSEEFNEFAEDAGETVADLLYELLNKSYIEPADVASDYVEIRYKDGSDLSVNLSDPYEIRLELTDQENLVMVKAFEELVEEVYEGDMVLPNVSSAVSNLAVDINDTTTVKLSETETLYVVRYDIDLGDGTIDTVYVVQFLVVEQ